MALNTQDPVLAKRRFFHSVVASGSAAAGGDGATYKMAIEFFSWLMQQGGRPNLQVVEITALTNTDQVIANAACKLYALILKKLTATATFSKGTDHASTCSTDGTQDFSLKMADTYAHQVWWPRGRACASGWTMQGNTTGTGSSGSGANGAFGVCLLGDA